jgi:Short C-terminal domain
MHEQARDFRGGAEIFREMMDMKMEMFVAQLRKMGELREEGLLTEEEFSAAKAKLIEQLGR